MSELRYTDDSPPRSVLENVANWVHAYGEEGRRGQDETTIKPQRRQDRIDEETNYTTADVWLANGDVCLALITLTSGFATEIEVFEDETFWRVYRNGTTGKWAMNSFHNPTGIQISDKVRFPVSYCSRLPYEKELPIKGIINPDGSWSEWVIE